MDDTFIDPKQAYGIANHQPGQARLIYKRVLNQLRQPFHLF